MTTLKSNFQSVTTSWVPTSQGQKVLGDEEFEDEELTALGSCVDRALSGVSVGGLVAPLAVRMDSHWFLSMRPPLQQPVCQIQVAQRGSDVECYLQLKPGKAGQERFTSVCKISLWIILHKNSHS